MQSGARPMSASEFERKIGNEAQIHFLGIILPRRPGVLLFATRLEFIHFLPGTPGNDDYEITLIKWEDMVWIAVSIPKNKMNIARTVAEETGIRIADGVPTSVRPGKKVQQLVPGESRNVFTLENVPGHPLYQGSSKEMIEAEDAEIIRLQQEGGKRN